MKKNNLAPICLFTYNRLEETRKTIEALQKNYLARESELFVFSDGWKSETSKEKIESVRAFLKTITGFKKVTIIEKKINNGLANSIINGVTQIINEYGNVIVLEDDLVTSPNFLNFMNQSLGFYENNNKIFSISGYTLNLKSLKTLREDVYLGYRASSWGWATWKRSWIDIDWEIKDYLEFKKSIFKKKRFNNGGSDMTKMLQNQMMGKIDSWAIRWCYNQYKRNQYTVFPKESKVISIGFGENATHTKKTQRFDTVLDSEGEVNFLFVNTNDTNKKLMKEFKAKFSVLNRLKDKIL